MPSIHATPLLLPLVLAMSAGFAAAQAQAQTAIPPAAAAKAQGGGNVMDAVVVTGTASHAGQKLLSTTFSISSISEEGIKEAAPSSTADLLKIVPGIFVESSGGTAGANISVRGFPTSGDAPYVTMQLDGVPMYPAATLSFMENSSLFRLDDTVERVEVLRGGPSPIWSNGQAGATANFIQKRGSDQSEGSLRYTTGTGGLQRVDVYYGGKLSEGWYISGGGFYRTSTGVRDTQYPADEGGQFSLNLTRRIDGGGSLNLWARASSDKNTFFTGIPLTSSNGGTKVGSFPGLDALTGALQGSALRNVMLETTPGATPGTMKVDLADGRGLQSTMVGLDFNKKFGDWTFSDRAGYMSGKVPTKALFTGGAPATLASYISGKVTDANGNAAVLAAAGSPATGGTASYLDGRAISDMNQPVMSAGIWSVDKDVRAFTNDARLNRELAGGHTLSLGLYLASYSSNDLWYLGNGMLMTAQHHAQPINVTLNNGVKVTRNGFDGASFYSLDANYSGNNVAATVADEWKVNRDLRLDVGARWERERITGSVGQPLSGDLDGNPLTLYNNNASYLSGTYKPVDFNQSKTSYTAGAGYMLSEQVNTFVRINSGLRFPSFDDLRDGNRAVETVKQYEIGLKAASRNYSLFLTAFHNDFKGQPQTQFLADGTQLNFLLGSKTNGIEFEGLLRPLMDFRGFELTVGGNWIKAEYVDSGSLSGLQVQRQPKFQARLSPSYRINTGWGSAKVFATYSVVGKRFGDVQNQQPLPRYNTLDAGVITNLGDFELRLTGSNLTNQIGITEGNARVVGAGTTAQGVFIGRPIFGRSVQLSLAAAF